MLYRSYSTVEKTREGGKLFELVDSIAAFV